MRPAVRLPGMRRAFSPCHPDRARLPHHVGRRSSGRRKVRAHHRKIRWARTAAIRAPSWIVQEGATSPKAKTVSASLTESRVASSLKHRQAAYGYCASAMLGGPNGVSPEIARRVAAPLRLLRHSGRSVYARLRVTPLGEQT